MTLLHFLQSFSLSRTLLPYLDVPVICTQDKLHTFLVFKIMFRNYDQFKTRSTLSIHTELGKIVCLNINRKCRTTIYVTQIIWHLQREIQMIKHNGKSLWRIVRKKNIFQAIELLYCTLPTVMWYHPVNCCTISFFNRLYILFYACMKVKFCYIFSASSFFFTFFIVFDYSLKAWHFSEILD